jgi:hypothetical protein
MQVSRSLSLDSIRRVAATLALAGMAGAALFWVPKAHATQFVVPDEPRIPAGAPIRSWADNGQAGLSLLQIIDGIALPRGATLRGTVTSDTNCAPDARGLSHCHNGIDLDNGMRIVVVHTHAMMQHPCLKPGQRITVTGFSGTWITARTAGA